MYLANVCCEKAAEDQISVITGFAPTEDEKRLTEALDKEDVFYMKSSASIDDNPPIKLKSQQVHKYVLGIDKDVWSSGLQ
jgi:vacuolar-type H+-ATPase subunit I/STV1